MGCNCGKKTGTVKYVFITPEGRRVDFSSEVQARAAQIRAGGGGRIETRAA